MTVKQLIEKLQKVAPDMLVVTRGQDHSYNNLDFATEEQAELYSYGHMSEYYGGQTKYDVLDVLVVG